MSQSPLLEMSAAELERLLPHGASLCMAEQVLRVEEKRLLARCRPVQPDQHLFWRADGVHSVVLVEYAAQIAALHLQRGVGGQRPQHGVLAAVRRLELEQSRIPAGRPVEVQVNQLGSTRGGAKYHFEARCDGQELASGELTIAFVDG